MSEVDVIRKIRLLHEVQQVIRDAKAEADLLKQEIIAYINAEDLEAMDRDYDLGSPFGDKIVPGVQRL